MKLVNRLQRLEKVARVTRATDEAHRQRVEESNAELEAAWEIMRETMSEEHAQLVVEAYAAGMQDTRHPEWNSPAAALLRRCLDAMESRRHWPYSEINQDVAFAMPPEVAQVYLQHPHVLPFHDCGDCGYKVPIEYFDQCPLCGGKVGWYAYWEKHKESPRPS